MQSGYFWAEVLIGALTFLRDKLAIPKKHAQLQLRICLVESCPVCLFAKRLRSTST